jgi:hypothetical protein
MIACRVKPGPAFTRAACQPIVSGVREFCIAAKQSGYQPMLALGPLFETPGVKVAPPESFSPGTLAAG